MYITVNNIKVEKRIDLSYSIQNFDSGKEIAVIRIINLDELNNSVNLKDGRPSNTLFTYHVTDDKDFTCFEPPNPTVQGP